MPRITTHIRVVREDNSGNRQEFPTLAFAYRTLLGTPSELGASESQRIRAALRGGETARDRHGFTWRSLSGTVAEASIAWTDFTFGVELELLYPSGAYIQQIVARNGDGGWRVVGDGSLSGAPGFTPAEVVSPVLKGEAGLAALKKMMDALLDAGCRVNRSCGMHVHIGVRGMKPSRVRKIALAFLNAERHFDAIVPPSRRNNQYARSNRDRVQTSFSDQGRLDRAESISAIADVMNGGNSPRHYNPYRYFKLNFQSYVQHGTIEFRQHAGTVESEKALAWVRLVAGFCASAAAREQERFGGEALSFDEFLHRSTDEAGVAFMKARREKFLTPQRAAA
jgi:hypothetical protein